VGNELGLSKPVYEFLRFLQKYNPDLKGIEHNQDIIAFAEKEQPNKGIFYEITNNRQIVFAENETQDYIHLMFCY